MGTLGECVSFHPVSSVIHVVCSGFRLMDFRLFKSTGSCCFPALAAHHPPRMVLIPRWSEVHFSASSSFVPCVLGASIFFPNCFLCLRSHPLSSTDILVHIFHGPYLPFLSRIRHFCIHSSSNCFVPAVEAPFLCSPVKAGPLNGAVPVRCPSQ